MAKLAKKCKHEQEKHAKIFQMWTTPPSCSLRHLQTTNHITWPTSIIAMAVRAIIDKALLPTLSATTHAFLVHAFSIAAFELIAAIENRS